MKEIASGRYHVEVEIPWRVDTGRVEVNYADGFLTIVLPADRSAAASVGSAPAA
jgi:HSP20 family molecular chaperone IbpA